MTMITTENVAAGFDEAAPRYDLMVALNPGLSPPSAGRGRRTGRPAVRDPEVSSGHHPVGLLDLGCGSGASTRAVLRAAQAAGLRTRSSASTPPRACSSQARAKSGRTAYGSSSAWPRSAPGSRDAVGN